LLQVMTIKGGGTVACGVVIAGTARVGNVVVWGGASRPHCRAVIRSIEHFHKPAETCKAGDMVGVALRYVWMQILL
jgi:translation elongation factor EF-Tu-like GTPase